MADLIIHASKSQINVKLVTDKSFQIFEGFSSLSVTAGEWCIATFIIKQTKKNAAYLTQTFVMSHETNILHVEFIISLN